MLSYISSFKTFYWNLTTTFRDFDPAALLAPETVRSAALLLAALLLFLIARRWSRRHWLAGATSILVIFLGARLLLFQNAVAWRVYEALGVETMGYRYRDMALASVKRFRAPDTGLPRVVALGTSQTGAIYGYARASQDHADAGVQLESFVVAGLPPAGLYALRDFILDQPPRIILLQMSEFDLGRPFGVDNLDGLPIPIADVPMLSRMIADQQGWREGIRAAARLTVSAVCIECATRFATRGLALLLTGGQAVVPHPDSKRPAVATDETLARQLGRLGQLSSQYFTMNLEVLDRFLAASGKAGTRVVVIEGQYHPHAYSTENRQLNAEAKSRLREIVSRHPTATFWEVDETLTFDPQEYVDGYHVSPEAGRRYTQRIISRLIRTGL